MPNVTSIGSALKESDHEPGEFADAENAEFSNHLGEGSARKAEEPTAAQAGTGSQQGEKRRTLLSLPPEMHQEIMGHLAPDGKAPWTYFDARNARLTHRSLNEAFLHGPRLKGAYSDAYTAIKEGKSADRMNFAIEDINRPDLPVTERAQLTADQAIARYDVPDALQGAVRQAGARRDVESGLLSADAAIERHNITDVGMQDRMRLVGAVSDVEDRGMTVSEASQRHGTDPDALNEELEVTRWILSDEGGSD